MRPHQIILTIESIVFVITMSCSPKVVDVNKNQWQDKGAIADGNPSEWQALRYTNKNTRLTYDLSNDDQNLYICIQASDETTQLKILKAGMSVWIDTTGGKHEHVGILFPFIDKNSALPEMGPPSGSDRSARIKKLKDEFLSNTNNQRVSMVHFKNSLDNLTITNSKDIKINWNSYDIMVYEAIIPLKAFFKERLSKADTTRVFGFSVKINALQKPQLSGGMPAGGMPGGGMGPPPGGRMPSGGVPSGGGRDDMSELFLEKAFSTKFKLVLK